MAKTRKEMKELKESIKRGMEGHKMPKEGAERLFTLAALLRTVPPERLDMNSYISSGDPVLLDDPECGTAACALGWCTVQWPREFKQVVDGGGYSGISLFGVEVHFHDPAVSKFFGLPVHGIAGCEYAHVVVTHALFGRDEEWSRRTPKQEAELLEYAAQCCGWYPVQEEN